MPALPASSSSRYPESPRTRWSPPEQKASGPSPVSTITPTAVSSCASRNALRHLDHGARAKRVSDLGPGDRDLGDALIRRRGLLVADVRVSALGAARRLYPPRGHGAKASLCAMVVEGWLERAAKARPERTAVQTPVGSWSYAELLAAASFGAGELAAARRASRAERRDRPARRGSPSPRPSTPVCCSVRSRCPWTSAPRRPNASGSPSGPRSSWRRRWAFPVRGALSRSPAGTSQRRAGPRADDGARSGHELDDPAVVIHTSGTTSSARPVELTYGNFLWSALGSAVALGLDPGERWLCALPVSHVGGLSILVRSAVYATTAVVHERFDTDRVLDALREQQITLVSLVATTLARLLDAGLQQPAVAALRADRRRPRAGDAACRERAPRGCPSARPTGSPRAARRSARSPWRRSREERPERRSTAVLHARAHRFRRGDPRAGADRGAAARARPRRMAAHRRSRQPRRRGPAGGGRAQGGHDRERR